jgi:hypothetical protein
MNRRNLIKTAIACLAAPLPLAKVHSFEGRLPVRTRREYFDREGNVVGVEYSFENNEHFTFGVVPH